MLLRWAIEGDRSLLISLSEPKQRVLALTRAGSTMRQEQAVVYFIRLAIRHAPEILFLVAAVFCLRASHTMHTQSGDWDGCV
jgi:hypothetical protein